MIIAETMRININTVLNNLKIIGLDVCKLSVVAFIISMGPSDPRQYYYDAKFHTFVGVVQKRGILGNAPQVKMSQVLTSLQEQKYDYGSLLFRLFEKAQIPIVPANVDGFHPSSIR